jgi:general secretion pathway protein B
VYRQPANPSVRSLADEAGTLPPADDLSTADPQMNPALAAATAAPTGPAMVRPIQPPNVTPLPRASSPAVATNSGRERPDNEVLPTATDLAAGGTNLPEMKLDIHVYSKTPTERFVFINMRKYQEGQALQEGPVLEKITNDGAVLNQHGLRFSLPRQ